VVSIYPKKGERVMAYLMGLQGEAGDDESSGSGNSACRPWCVGAKGSIRAEEGDDSKGRRGKKEVRSSFASDDLRSKEKGEAPRKRETNQGVLRIYVRVKHADLAAQSLVGGTERTRGPTKGYQNNA